MMAEKRRHLYFKNRVILVVALFIMALLAACNGKQVMVLSPTVTPTPTSTAVHTATPEPIATLSPTRTPRPTEVPISIAKDITYTYGLQPDVKDRALDIYAPEKSGNWPVIILAHGFQQTKEAFGRMGKDLAREGTVVFVIDWPAWSTASASGDGSNLREQTETFNCAVRFARSEAIDYTKTPDRITMIGYSMGGWFGLLTSIAGDSLDNQWKTYENSHGGPTPQVFCAITEGTANVDAFVGYGGAYTQINPTDKMRPDMLHIVSIADHIGENPDLLIRAIQGRFDNMLTEEIIQTSEELVVKFADAGYDAQWIEVDGGHGFSPSGQLWEHNRQVILEAARP
jgi:dienelactone hydrolase